MTAEPAERDSYTARGANGKFLRTADSIARDRQADSLVAQGWSYQQTADHLGYADKSDCWRGVQRVRREAAEMDGSTTMIRERQLAELAELRRRLWDQINNPAVAISRTGKIVTDASGKPLADAQAVIAAEALLVRVSEREARIRGSDPPKRHVSISGNVTVEELAIILANTTKEDIRAAFDQANRIIQAETERLQRDHAPRAIPAGLE